MNPREPFDEIGELLRSRKPDPRPAPGLESRIMQALPERKGRTVWPWFVLPPAVAMAVLLLSPKPATEPAHANTGSAGFIPPEPAAMPSELANPLELEKLALQRDARRAGRFLIDCLPSVGSGD